MGVSVYISVSMNEQGGVTEPFNTTLLKSMQIDSSAECGLVAT